MILDTATKVIRFRLGGAVAASEIDWNATWADHNSGARTFRPGHQAGASNGASNVTVVAAPAANVERHVKSLYWHNLDSSPVNVIVETYNGTTARRWYVAVLDPGWTLEWEAGGSWKVYDANGRQKVETTPGGGGPGGGIALAVAGSTASSGTVLFSNANGITFGMAGSVMTASHNGLTSQSNQQIALYPSSQTTGPASSGTVDARSMSIIGAGLVSVGYSAGALVISASSAPQSNQTHGLYMAGNTTQGSSGTQDARSISFFGAGNVSVGFTNGSIVISATGGGGGVTPALSGSNGSFTFSTASWGALNGITFYTSNGSMVASYTVPSVPGQSVQPVAASGSNGSFNFSTISFGASNGITFYSTNGSMVASHNALTSQSNQAASGSNGSFTFQTLSFGNSNGLSFFSNGSQIVGSYTVPTQSVQSLGFYAVGNTTQSTSGTMDARTISFNGLGVASVGVSNGSILISVPAGGGGLTNINVSAGTTNQNLSNIVFADGGNVSFGMNGSTITASAPAGAAAPVLSLYDHIFPIAGTAAAVVAMSNSFFVQPVHLHNDYDFDYLRFYASLSDISTTWTRSAANTGYSGGISHTYWWKLYSMNTGASSYSAVSCIGSGAMGVSQQISLSQNTTQTNGSATYSVSYKATLPLGTGTTTYSTSTTGAGSSLTIHSALATLMSGWNIWDIPVANTIPAGAYYLVLGANSATATQGSNIITGGGFRQSHIVVTQINSNFRAPGVGGAYGFQAGLGVITSAGTTLPATAYDVLTNVATQASHILVPFAGLRFA